MELWRNGDAQHERIASITFDDGLTSPMRWINEMNEINLRPSLFVCGDPLINNRPLDIHKSLFAHQYQKTNLVDLDTLTQSFTRMMEDGFSQTDDFASFVSENYLSEEEVHHLLRDNRIGVLGSHTWSHRSLSHADSNSSFSENLEFQSYQIVDCHHAMQEIFQENLQLFSYPFGKMDRQSFVSELLARKVCRDIFHCNGGINVTPCSIGSVLRISVRDLNRRELEQLLRIQWAR